MTYYTAICKHCNLKNKYDLNKLNESSEAPKLVDYQPAHPVNDVQEYLVTCEHCYKTFKIKLPKARAL